ncbi:peptidase M48, Ste24p [Magnetococcus marinus MC-1]|uniref:Peptidase M48, Ste24p n=1 Tax=Magnetococcus marinus (strain ATCC BAA-1437 / JCM 17883 / MC-1) TaxID=156889 RepID=A0L918_MAGMM|nr:M48 family metallopeptidase [Magnetococcus marinus]ABK44461.1 peptidase M48, Ste24p [Magnetococcus marinus MC-1]
MTTLQGHYFNGQNSQAETATLELSPQGLLRLVRQDGTVKTLYPGDRTISPPMGNTPMRIRFGQGEQFVTQQSPALLNYMAEHKEGRLERGVHRMEKGWHWVFVAILIVGGFIWGLFQYGVPLAAQALTAMLPAEVDARIGKRALETLDNGLFKVPPLMQPSRLSDRQQAHYQQLFAQTIKALPTRDDLPYTLHFRQSKLLGANALALPSGDIIATDAFIQLLKHDTEFQVVIAHELGHIFERHSVKLLVRSTLVSLTTSLLIGDPSSSFDDLIISMPVLLNQLSYGRAFEERADRFALQFMREQQIPAERFIGILERLEKNAAARKQANPKTDHTKAQRQGNLAEYLSSHPFTERRATYIRSALGGE